MNAVTTRMGMFPSRLEAWKQARAFIEDFCRGAQVPRESCLKANLVIEELFTNTVRHGYRGECDHPVWLHALPAPGRLCLTYQDAAAAFDPLAVQPQAAHEAPQCIGGQGIPLVCALASSIAYRRVEDRNILTLLFAAAPG